MIKESFIAFFSFCMSASSIYCLNDLIDAKIDRLHPNKRNRPIASGSISKRQALLIFSILLLFAIAISCVHFERHPFLFIIIGIYILMNIGYCLKLKRIAIIDVFIIAFGFVLRIMAGGASTGIELSHWVVLMTFLLSLILALAKRRDDVCIYDKTGVKMRKNITRYSLTFIDMCISIISSITIVCYIMYTVSPEVVERFQSTYIYLTVLFVMAGIIRYLQLTMVDKKSESPTMIMMKDRFIQLCVIAWGISFTLIIYLK